MSNVLSHSEVLRQPATRPTRLASPVAGVRFTWLMALVGLYTVAGAYLDGWAHSNGKTDESFFTPWHGVLYSGLLFAGLILGITILRNLSLGHSARTALPTAYRLAFLGVGVFAVGGVGDLIWHTLFGIEKGFEALYSPSHLTLGVGICLLALGPATAALQRPASALRSWRDQAPMLISLTAFLAGLAFFTQDIHWIEALPRFSQQRLGQSFYDVQMVGFSAILLQSALMMGVILFAIRHWRLVPGALTFIIGLSAISIGFQDDVYRSHLVGAAIVAGIVGDILLATLRPSLDRPGMFRLFAVALPIVFFSIYFGVLRAVEGLGWSIHLWTGAVFLAGVVGWPLSYAFVPPALPSE